MGATKYAPKKIAIAEYKLQEIREFTQVHKFSIAKLELEKIFPMIDEAKQKTLSIRNRLIENETPIETHEVIITPTKQSPIKKQVSNKIETEKIIRIYKVKKGDYLYQLAREIYKDPSQWKLIYEANKSKIPETLVLTPGIVLMIPELP